MQLTSSSDKETIQAGKRFSKKLKKGDIVCLKGDLGAGKTTFVKGVAEGLKIKKESVNSPTFVLLNIYEGSKVLYHFDLYRLDDTKQIGLIGYEEFLYGDGVAMVEWSENLGELMPKDYWEVRLAHKGDHTRQIKINRVGGK